MTITFSNSTRFNIPLNRCTHQYTNRGRIADLNSAVDDDLYLVGKSIGLSYNPKIIRIERGFAVTSAGRKIAVTNKTEFVDGYGRTL